MPASPNTKEIILNCMPPFSINTPSPALSILKAYLCKNGYSVRILYWNILLHKLENEFIWYKQNTRKGSQHATIIYAAYLAIKTKNEPLYNEIKAVLQTILPIMLNEANFYDEHIKKYTQKLELFIDNYLNNIDFTNVLYLGFSMKLDQWMLASVIAEKMKKRNPNVPIVIGGINTAEVAKAFIDNFKQFDIAIWGEGEIPLLNLTHFFFNENIFSLFNIERLFYRENGIVKETSPKKHLFFDLSENELYPDFSDYFEFNKQSKRAILYIEGGRGCHWNKCHFCYLNEGYRYRQKSVEKISNEIEQLITAYSVNHFAFTDNDLIGKDINRFHSLLNELLEIKKKYPNFILSGIQVMPRDLSGQIINKMRNVGVVSLQIGFECASNNLLKKIEKKNTFASNLNAMKHCTEVGINVVGVNVIYNLLEEEVKDIYESIDNFRFIRFILEKNPPKIVPLAINSSSKYFNAILNQKQEYLPRLNTFHKTFIDFFSEEDKWHFFEFILKYKDEKWEYLADIQIHYMSNKYKYLFISENDKVTYQEQFNSEVIEHIEFEKNELYIPILKYCYNKPVTISELQNYLMEKNIKFPDTETLVEQIDFLFSQGLVYRTPDFDEIVSIVNTEKYENN